MVLTAPRIYKGYRKAFGYSKERAREVTIEYMRFLQSLEALKKRLKK